MKARITEPKKQETDREQLELDVKLDKKKIRRAVILTIILAISIIALSILKGFSILTALSIWFGVNLIISIGTYIIKTNFQVSIWLRLAFKLPKPNELSDEEESSLLTNVTINFIALCIALFIKAFTDF